MLAIRWKLVLQKDNNLVENYFKVYPLRTVFRVSTPGPPEIDIEYLNNKTCSHLGVIRETFVRRFVAKLDKLTQRRHFHVEKAVPY